KPGLVEASAATAARRVAEAAQTFLLFGTQGHGPRGIASGRHRGDGRRQRAAQSLDALPLVARAIARLARIAREVEQLGLSAEDELPLAVPQAAEARPPAVEPAEEGFGIKPLGREALLLQGRS